MAKVAGFKKAADNPVKVRDRGPYRTAAPSVEAEPPKLSGGILTSFEFALKEYLPDAYVAIESGWSGTNQAKQITVSKVIDGWEVVGTRKISLEEVFAARGNIGAFFEKVTRGLDAFRTKARKEYGFPGAQCIVPRGPAANPCLSERSISGDKHDAEE